MNLTGGMELKNNTVQPIEVEEKESTRTEKETQIPQWQESMLRVFLANH